MKEKARRKSEKYGSEAQPRIHIFHDFWGLFPEYSEKLRGWVQYLIYNTTSRQNWACSDADLHLIGQKLWKIWATVTFFILFTVAHIIHCSLVNMDLKGSKISTFSARACCIKQNLSLEHGARLKPALMIKIITKATVTLVQNVLN